MASVDFTGPNPTTGYANYEPQPAQFVGNTVYDDPPPLALVNNPLFFLSSVPCLLQISKGPRWTVLISREPKSYCRFPSNLCPTRPYRARSTSA